MSKHSRTQLRKSAGTPERDGLSNKQAWEQGTPHKCGSLTNATPMGRAGLVVGFQMLLITELQGRQSPRAAAEGMLNTHDFLPPREDKTS